MRSHLLLFFFLIYSAFKAQTLYWVGGSGNFNDPNHWSLSSAGPVANMVPGNNTDVVFDDNSGSDIFAVNFNGLSNIRSLKANNISVPIVFTGAKSSVLDVSGFFWLSSYCKWDNSGTVNFRSKDQGIKPINFGMNQVKGDLYFNEGSFRIYSLSQVPGNKTNFSNGTYIFNKASFSGDELIIKGTNTSFVIDTSYFLIKDKLTINDIPAFTSNKFAFYAPFSNKAKAKYSQSLDFGSGAKLVDNSLAVVCAASVSTKPSCSGTCTGIFSMTLDPTCVNPPYNIIVSNTDPSTDCQNTATNLSANNIPNTYSVGGACYCPGAQYVAFVLDGSFVPIPITVNGVPTSNFNFQPPSFGLPTLSQMQPSCFSSCNGTISLAISGGQSPYTVTVTPPSAGPFTFTAAAGFTLGSLCAGVYSFQVTDANDCVSGIIQKTVNAPPPVLTGSVATNVACFGDCTGSLVISPSGGVGATYTVAFNPGGTFTVAAGGSASVTGLCAGTAISATVTDVNSCSATANATITQPSTVNIVPTQTNIACSGVCSGAASVQVSGAVPPYGYTWSPGPGSAPGITNLCPGVHTVIVSNNGGLCTNEITFTLTEPPPVLPNATVTNITCNGLCNGSATLNPSGGNGPAYSYTWNPMPGGGQGTGTVSGLCEGSHTVTIGDALGCTTTAVISVTAPPAYTVTASTQSLACFNVCTGAASLVVSGNNPGYNFTWTPNPPVGQSTGTISSLCAGDYTANITDAIGCPTTMVVSITQPSSITPNITSTSITCNGGCNGSIDANPSGGSLPYTFTLVTPTSASIVANPPFNGLCAGLYTLFITAGNCPQSFTVNLAQPNPLIAGVVVTSVTCFNACNGSLAGNVVGGTPGYTLVWTTPSGTVSGGVITNQCAGNYTLTVTDANNCTVTQTAVVNEPPQITATINPTNPLCSGSCNGVLNAVVAGGTPGYTLSWSNGFIGNPNTGLCAGNYTLTVTDANNCTNTFTIDLIAPPAITATINTTNPVCAGNCNGSATVTAGGGTPSYTYQFNTVPVTNNVTGIVSGLCPGNYIATVIDANGCSQPISFSITNPPVLSVSVPSIQTSCNACTGGATLVASGGTPTYSSVWTNSLSVTVGTGSAVTGLCPGNFTATVTDAAGCTATAGINIAQTVTVTVLLAGSGIQCFNGCTGSVVATATGGNPLYTYSWTPGGQTTQTATSLCAGTYTVFVEDANLCSNTATITLANPPDITITSSQTNVICNGDCNGAITTTVSGGTGTLSYAWSNGPTTPSVGGLCANDYTLTVTDENNCNKSQTFTITESPAMTATFDISNPNACGANNGSICATVVGGTGTYTYNWTPIAGTSSCITGLGAGTYSLIVTDAAACSVTLGTSLTNPTGPTLTIVTESVSCFGGNNGGATVTASGVGPAYTFTWTPAISFTNSATTSTVSGLLTGTYNVAATGSNNCITSQSIAINQAPSFTVTSSVTNPLCNGDSNGSITINTSGGTPTYTWNWVPTGTLVGQGTQTITNLSQNIYTVTITDANNCVQTRTFNVVAPPALTLTTVSSNVQCNGAANGSIVATGTGGTPLISYSWVPVGGFGGAVTSTVTGLGPNTYTVIITDNNGCSTSTTVPITEPPVLTSTLTLLDATCSNSCNATATHVASGGTPGYNFSWSGSPVTTSTIGNLCAGSYTATVTDLNGCPSVQNFTVTAPAPFTATLTPTNPLCNAACNGSISTILAGEQGTVSFNWSPSGTGQNPTGLCPNSYTLVATDATGCQLNAVTTLTNPPALLAQVSTTNPACNGTCNGIAISNPTNNVGTVNYTWTPAAPNSPTNSGLCSGDYTLVISDDNGCQDVQTFTLTNPPALVVNPAITPATCSFSNGAITVGVAGGTPTYNFAWLPPGPTGSVATGLGAGVYTVTVTDNNNCTNSVAIALSNANGPSVTPVSTASIDCNGASTGSAAVITSSISGGTPGYTVSWLSPPAPSTTNPLVNLPAGSYTAQITDANSCILFTTAIISEPPPIIITPSFTLPTCNGICNGSIDLNASGGTPGYTYSWTTVSNTAATLGSACAGDYTIIVTDNLNCASTQTLNLPPTQVMTATTSVTPNLCFNNCAGSATVGNIQNGTAPLVFSWSNGQTANTATSLCNGTYSVMITDANSCFTTFTASITSPAQITATTSISSPGCNMCNGTSTIAAGGGVSPFTYSWTSGATGTVAGNLCAGLYQVLVTDQNSCTVTENVLVSSANGITGETFTVQNETCAGLCNGSVAVSPIGGTPAYTYSWIAPSSTASSLTNLCAGDYFLQITDSAGCIRTTSTSIIAATALTVSPFIIQPSCGNSNGSFSLAVSGGTPAYTYSWSPISNTNSAVSGLGAGIYTVTVTDGLGCNQTQVFSLNNSNAPVITFTQSNLGCFNVCTGSVIALGTSTASPVTYSWSTGSTSQTITGQCAGVITLTVSAGGCDAFQTFTLTENPAMQLSLSNIIQPQCFDDCNGEITLIPSGGTIPYTFSWSPGSATINPNQNLCAGPGASTTYTAIVTDAVGCSVTETVNLVNPAMLSSAKSLTLSSCSSVADGAAAVTPTGGTSPYTFNWTGPNFTATTQIVNGILAGTYTVLVTDSRNCTTTDTLQLSSSIVVLADAGADSAFCFTGTLTLSGNNSVGANEYNWFLLPEATNSLATTSTLNINPLSAGTFTYLLEIISGVNVSCRDTDSVVVNVLSLPLVDAGPSYTIPVFSSVTIGGNPTAPTATSITWMPPFTLDDPNIQNPVASNTVNTTYTVTITDANGCQASDTVQVILYPQIIIPNGFSPNGDGKNDKWMIDYIDQFPDCTVEVYNRWGEQLFFSRGYTVLFDGRYNNKDLPVGTYYYVINLNHPAYTTPYTGPLTIFR